jgi:nicotinamide phosphoribosyltransferase
VTDKVKKSKKGRLTLIRGGGDQNIEREYGPQFFTLPEGSIGEHVLVPVFENGKILKEYTFTEVRKNSEM